MSKEGSGALHKFVLEVATEKLETETSKELRSSSENEDHLKSSFPVNDQAHFSLIQDHLKAMLERPTDIYL